MKSNLLDRPTRRRLAEVNQKGSGIGLKRGMEIVRLRPYPWVLLTGLQVAAGFAFAQQGEQVDPRTLYEITTPTSAQKVKAGSKGSVAIAIKTKNGSHASCQAPFKVEVHGKGAQPAKYPPNPPHALPTP